MPIDFIDYSRWCFVEDLIDYIKLFANNGVIERKYRKISYKEVDYTSGSDLKNVMMKIKSIFDSDRFIFLYASHYVSYVKNDNGSWQIFDDQKQEPEDIPSIQDEINGLFNKYGGFFWKGDLLVNVI